MRNKLIICLLLLILALPIVAQDDSDENTTGFPPLDPSNVVEIASTSIQDVVWWDIVWNQNMLSIQVLSLVDPMRGMEWLHYVVNSGSSDIIQAVDIPVVNPQLAFRQEEAGQYVEQYTGLTLTLDSFLRGYDLDDTGTRLVLGSGDQYTETVSVYEISSGELELQIQQQIANYSESFWPRWYDDTRIILASEESILIWDTEAMSIQAVDLSTVMVDGVYVKVLDIGLPSMPVFMLLQEDGGETPYIVDVDALAIEPVDYIPMDATRSFTVFEPVAEGRYVLTAQCLDDACVNSIAQLYDSVSGDLWLESPSVAGGIVSGDFTLDGGVLAILSDYRNEDGDSIYNLTLFASPPN